MIVVTLLKLSRVAPDLYTKNGITVYVRKLTAAIPTKLPATFQPFSQFWSYSSSLKIKAYPNVIKVPKSPIKPKKLNTSSFFFSKYSYRTFSVAYRNAPKSAQTSPKMGLDASDVSLKYKKSFRNPTDIPRIQTDIPSQCLLKYETFKNTIERTTADGIEKSSMIMTDVIEVIV